MVRREEELRAESTVCVNVSVNKGEGAVNGKLLPVYCRKQRFRRYEPLIGAAVFILAATSRAAHG